MKRDIRPIPGQQKLMKGNIHQKEIIRRAQERIKKIIEVDYCQERSERTIREVELIPESAASTTTQKIKNRKVRSPSKIPV